MASKAAIAAIAQSAAKSEKEHEAVTKQAAANLDKFGKTAAKNVNLIEANSRLFTKAQLDAIPKFFVDELTLGRVLGKGGFGTVKEIRYIKCKANTGSVRAASPVNDKDDVREQELQDKQFIADHCIRDGGDARYCVKALSPNVVTDETMFTHGVVDMAAETMFLSVISHPHIITMRGYSANGMIKPDHFIILDRLYDTLEARIPKWKVQAKRARSFVNKLKKSSSRKLEELMETKLSYAYDLAGAFEYLHKHKIIYRDLKPENVGFNVRDDIILFDFGLSKEITNDEEKVTDDTWNLTGETGSLRYMAPEVADNKPYGYSSDMYSFAIMLWEMLQMEIPFPRYTKKAHSELVVKKGGRPKIEDSWGPGMKGFLKSCWNQDLKRRPTAAKASLILKREAAKASGGGVVELNNFRRKSTFVNRDSLRERRAKMKQSVTTSSRGEMNGQ